MIKQLKERWHLIMAKINGKQNKCNIVYSVSLRNCKIFKSYIFLKMCITSKILIMAIYPLHIADRENSRYIQDAPSHKTGPWWPHRLQNTPPCTPTQDLLLHIGKILHWTRDYNSLFIVYGPHPKHEPKTHSLKLKTAHK